MRLGFLTCRNLGFEGGVNQFYLKNHRNNKWARLWFPFEKQIRKEEAFFMLLGFYLSFERRQSGDVLNDSTNVLADKKYVSVISAMQRIQLTYCMHKMKELDISLADAQYTILMIDQNKITGEK